MPGAGETDKAWEALVRATKANPHASRGQLNTALKAIREAWVDDGLLEDDLPEEITRRAEQYRRMWSHLTLTPMALSVHWYRLAPEESTVNKWFRRFE